MNPERIEFYNFSTLGHLYFMGCKDLISLDINVKKIKIKNTYIIGKSLIILSTILISFCFFFSIFLLIFYSYEKNVPTKNFV